MKPLGLAVPVLASATVIPRERNCPDIAATRTKSIIVWDGDCNTNGAANDLTGAQFLALNPTMNDNCYNLYAGCKYCVGPAPEPTPTPTPTPTPISDPICPTNYISQCDTSYTVKSGDYCNLIVTNTPGFTPEHFYEWNPAINNGSCDNLITNCKFCTHLGGIPPVPIPDPYQPNTGTGHKEYYQAKAGGYCWAFSQTYGINNTDFISGNPDVGPNCGNMQIGYCYCLRI
ncbi:hypothetical protein EK21DRAFT_109927 [Setomelanomma holmii]|uniref:LysM domain-containing protein n=1 Tax=Setomelanomma holmii TaxID=210430 RepID=A0A9P4HDC6_9PLEO|nr:hypothetical protein EK21DRAFT_109927 [Setomelanomma holmii]